MTSWRCGWAIALALAIIWQAPTAVGDPIAAPATSYPPLELKSQFGARSNWMLVIRQGPPTEDAGGNPAPGALDICLQKSANNPCEGALLSTGQSGSAPYASDWDPHYLRFDAPVYPDRRVRQPLLMLVTASLHAGDGGQAVVTQLLKYDPKRDAFERVYVHSTGTNHNEEVRFIPDGSLQGSVISAEPTSDAPFGYWITVNRFTPARTYRQTLRYRSATRYNDGNALAVIDSEMPAIEQRLGLWKPGLPLPTTKPCPSPHLIRMELWCEAATSPQ